MYAWNYQHRFYSRVFRLLTNVCCLRGLGEEVDAVVHDVLHVIQDARGEVREARLGCWSHGLLQHQMIGFELGPQISQLLHLGLDHCRSLIDAPNLLYIIQEPMDLVLKLKLLFHVKFPGVLSLSFQNRLKNLMLHSIKLALFWISTFVEIKQI